MKFCIATVFLLIFGAWISYPETPRSQALEATNISVEDGFKTFGSIAPYKGRPQNNAEILQRNASPISVSSAYVKLTEGSRVATNGMGPVLVGMTVREASRNAGVELISTYTNPNGCAFFRPRYGLTDVSFMATANRIARVDVRNPKVKTLRGAKVGDSEEKIKSLYAGQIQVKLHPYTGSRGGRYLIFVPKDREDQNFRIIFETSSGKVVQYRAGKLPEVDYIEGCS
ncbi:hypothetical protein NDA01_24795 [Trichocoleus desertorum AS-A10]|uniref:hypothetical protein n=1 Tax=Trichocoleus desertorum TaxID=1481672 RepID=UPI003299D31F